MKPSSHHVRLAYRAPSLNDGAVDCLLDQLGELGAMVLTHTVETDWLELSIAVDADDPTSGLVAAAAPVTSALARCGLMDAHLVEVRSALAGLERPS